MGPFADLHVHTTNSDGSLTLETIPGAAKQAGVRVVAITDHDRTHPALNTPVSTIDGITVIHGIELRVEGKQNVDLLGYGLTPTQDLTEELDRIQQNRIDRGTAIIENIENRLGITLDLEPRVGIGRPHIARAVASHPETEYDVQGVFDDLIGNGRPCYVAREIPSFEKGRTVLADACAIVSLAHPLRYKNPTAALELTKHLDAVERWYPYDDEYDLTPITDAIKSHDLIPTGGSDAHDEELGIAGLSQDEYQQVAEFFD